MTPNDGSSSGLRSSGSGRGPVHSLRKPDFQMSGFGRAGDDFAEHDRLLADLMSSAVEPERAAESGLAAALAVAPSAALSLRIDADGEDLLGDARADIAAGEYGFALALLDEYLERSPSHQEARFLRAFCLSRLEEPRSLEALRVLRPLRDEQTPAELRERVRGLRRELRGRLAPGEYRAYAETAKRDPGAALARVAGFLELAPEDGKLGYLLALGHARLGEFDEALEAAERGAAEADSDRERIVELARRLRLLQLRSVAEPAARAFKARDPRRARALLAAIDPRWRESDPVRDFDRYLALVIEHANPPVPPAPLLPDERADDLYSLIAEDDVQRAIQLMTGGSLEQAERLLERLLESVPGFAWLNFVYAICLYRRGRRPERAQACAEVALLDPTITQARDLLGAIHVWQEAVLINPAMDEFVAIADTLKDRVAPEMLPVLRTRLAGLERQIPALRRACRTADGRTALDELAAAIGTWRAELERAVEFGGFFEEYERVMGTAKGGIKDSAQAGRLGAALDALTARITAARGGAGAGRGGTHPLDELAGQVRARRAEVEQVKMSFQVTDLVQRFNALGSLIADKRGLGGSEVVREYARTIHRDAVRLRDTAGRKLAQRDRELLGQLIEASGRR